MDIKPQCSVLGAPAGNASRGTGGRQPEEPSLGEAEPPRLMGGYEGQQGQVNFAAEEEAPQQAPAAHPQWGPPKSCVPWGSAKVDVRLSQLPTLQHEPLSP